MRVALALAVVVALLAAVPCSADSKRHGEVATVVHDVPAPRPTLGPRFAPVTIEFFVDSHSSSSQWRYKQLRERTERHPTRLRVVFRFPCTDTFSNAARVAFRQGQFRALADAVYGGKRRRRSELEQIVRELGLDWERFEKQMSASYHKDWAKEDRFYARRWGLTRLSSRRPGILINGRPPPRISRRTLDSFEQAYDDAYRRALLLQARGVPLRLLYSSLLAEIVRTRRSPLELPIGAVDGPAISELERKNHPALAGPLDFELAHLDGPDDAAVTLSWFCSLQSQPCAKLFRTIFDVRAAFPDQLRVAFFHSFDPNDEDQPSAQLLHRAALCAEEQGDLWGFMRSTYARYPRGEVRPTFVEEVAKSIRLDEKRLSECVESPKIAKRLEEVIAGTRRARITRTPTVVVGGLAYLGSRDDFVEIAWLVESALQPGLLGRWLWPLGGN